MRAIPGIVKRSQLKVFACMCAQRARERAEVPCVHTRVRGRAAYSRAPRPEGTRWPWHGLGGVPDRVAGIRRAVLTKED